MRIAVGSDHAGYELKTELARQLADAGHDVVDFGTQSADVPVDYPVYGRAVAEFVVGGDADYGVCVCGTGIGISIAANKVTGARAALAYDVTTASLARRHNDANVLCLGGRTTGLAQATDAMATFLSTAFEGGRHQRRIDEITRSETGRASEAADRPDAVGRSVLQGSHRDDQGDHRDDQGDHRDDQGERQAPTR